MKRNPAHCNQEGEYLSRVDIANGSMEAIMPPDLLIKLGMDALYNGCTDFLFDISQMVKPRDL